MAKKKTSGTPRSGDVSTSATSRRTRGVAARQEGAPGGLDGRRGIAWGGLPAWLPWVAFGALVLWLFREFVFSDRMLLGNDTLGLGFVARDFYKQALASGDFPLWAPRILGGTPFVEALSGGDSLYPPSLILLLLLETHRALGWKLVLHALAAGLFMFGWVRALGASRAAGLVAGAGYLLAPMMIGFVRPGHDGKIFVIALAPLVFWAVERFFQRAGLARFAAVGLVVALVISTTHFQMAWFLFLAVGAYAAFRTVQIARGTAEGGGGAAPDDSRGSEAPGSAGAAGRSRPSAWAPAGGRFALFLVASVLGALAAGVQLLPAVDYVLDSSRRIATTRADAGQSGVAWSSSFALHPEEAMNIVIPEFSGNNAGSAAWASGTYWGRNGLKDNHESPGLLVVLLAAVAFAGARRRGVRLFLAGLATVAFLFSLGTHTPVWRIFYAAVPGISLFRAPSMVMFLVSFASATLAALAVDRLLRAGREGHDEGWRMPMRVLVAGTGLVALVTLLAASGTLASLWRTVVYPDMAPVQQQILEALQPFIVRGAFLSTALAAALLGLVWAFRRGMVPAAVLVGGLTGLVALDQLRFVGVFVQTLDYEAWAAPDPNIRVLLDREAGRDEPYRLLSFAEAAQDVQPALHGIELAAGHHPNDLARYRELIGMVGSGLPRNLQASPALLRLLNVRYVLWPDAEFGQSVQGPVISRSQLADGRVYQTLLAWDGLPRARLVGSAVVRSDEQAVPYMLSAAFDPEREVVLAEEPPIALSGGPVQGSVEWLERGLDRHHLRVTSDRPALLVVADNWFPAWTATVDGEEAPVLRAYHTLRAVPVPAGTHEVEMVYRSAVLRASAWLSGLVLAGLLALVVLGLWRARRPAGERPEGTPDGPHPAAAGAGS